MRIKQKYIIGWMLCTTLQIGLLAQNVPEITEHELRAHIAVLAADSMGGRPAESRIFEKAAAYAAGEFRNSGVGPAFTNTGGVKTYLQPVPFLKRKPGDKALLILRTERGDKRFVEHKHFKMNYCCHSDFPEGPTPLVDIGYGIEDPESGWNDFEGLDLTGKIAVMHIAPPEELHAKYDTRHGQTLRYQTAARHGAVGLICIADDRLENRWDRLFRLNFRIGLYYVGNAESSIPARQLEGIQGNRIVVKDDFVKFLFAGEEASQSRFQRAVLEYKKRPTGGEHISYNVGGFIEGSDADLRDEVIVIGAHLDHLPCDDGPVFNGADDNASGVAGVLEIAEALVDDPPKRSVLFVLFTAEEMGLYGSRHFIGNCPVPVENITAFINLDMIGRTSSRNLETRAHYVEEADAIDPGLKILIETVNEKTVQWPLLFQGNATSDHSHFLENGIPSATFFSGTHADYHQHTDDPEAIEYDKVHAISRLVHAVVRELGDAAEQHLKARP